MTYQEDISTAVEILNAGGIILYPTDTIWGIGCDATNESAIERIFFLKRRNSGKSLIILLSDFSSIKTYVTDPSETLLAYMRLQKEPLTAIFEKGKNLSDALIAGDGTVAIRVTKDDFCRELIKRTGFALTSTSANPSGQEYSGNFSGITEEIKNGVDYIAQHRRNDFNIYKPSTIIKLSNEGQIVTIR